jgi:bacterioferritin-associated ferredoxin
MYVCICNEVTDRSIREAAANGVRTIDELRRRTGCADCCGNCVDLAGEILESAARAHAFDLPLTAAAA